MDEPGDWNALSIAQDGELLLKRRRDRFLSWMSERIGQLSADEHRRRACARCVLDDASYLFGRVNRLPVGNPRLRQSTAHAPRECQPTPPPKHARDRRVAWVSRATLRRMPSRLRRDRVRRGAKRAFIGFVGPDGSGKTTVAAEVELQCSSLGRACVYVHWRPSLSAPFARPSPHATPLAKVASRENVNLFDQIASLARLLRSALSFNIVYTTRLRPQLRSGTVVVVDRWIYNYIAQPHSVRYYGPPRLAAFVCCRLVVQPSTVFVMEAPTRVIIARSDELTENEIDSEYERLHRSLRLSDVRWIDATSSPTEIAASVLQQCGVTGSQTV